MDFNESPQERAFRHELRTWLQANHPGPEPEDLDAWVAYGRGWQRRLHEAGWCGLAWPKEYGGRGATLVEQMIFEEEMARARAPMLINLAGLTMAGPILIAHGTEAQRRRYLPPILSADEIWCQGFSEPQAGSDLAALRTQAIRDGDQFVIRGQKVWTSFARYADWCMLLARTDTTVPKHKGITFFLVDMHSPGVTVRPLKQMNGDEDFNEVFFDDVRVPAENMVGGLNQGWPIAVSTLLYERTILTFARQLQSRTALSDTLRLAQRWRVNNRTAREDPITRQRLAQAWIESEAMKYTSYRYLTRLLRGGKPGPESSLEKLFWSEMYQRLLDTAVGMLGPYGALSKGEPRAPLHGRLQHLLLYSRGRTIAAGTSEIQRNTLAERVLGLPRGT
ncbi:MAG: acyl-CoA dehydrogenase [Candidatus Binatia bacterium]|nr:MAG: acyl-CoA dehydrogenase [Candidatus Binatia bacterium]